MMTSDRRRFESLLAAVKQVVPTLDDIRADRVTLYQQSRRSPSKKDRESEFEMREIVGDQLIFAGRTALRGTLACFLDEARLGRLGIAL